MPGRSRAIAPLTVAFAKSRAMATALYTFPPRTGGR
jgi:hypothetical protein